jgi:hypothetical protein
MRESAIVGWRRSLSTIVAKRFKRCVTSGCSTPTFRT